MERNKLFPRFRELKKRLHDLDHQGYEDWYEGAQEETERQAVKVRRQIAQFKPTETDVQEALEELYAQRESLANDLATVEAAIIELGGNT